MTWAFLQALQWEITLGRRRLLIWDLKKRHFTYAGVSTTDWILEAVAEETVRSLGRLRKGIALARRDCYFYHQCLYKMTLLNLPFLLFVLTLSGDDKHWAPLL